MNVVMVSAPIVFSTFSYEEHQLSKIEVAKLAWKDLWNNDFQ